MRKTVSNLNQTNEGEKNQLWRENPVVEQRFSPDARLLLTFLKVPADIPDPQGVSL